jgi:predicted transcriptional regulator of viral defense system
MKRHTEHTRALAGLSAHEREALSMFAAEEKTSVAVEDLLRLRPTQSRAAAQQALVRLCRKGWLHRLRRGTYGLVPLSSLTAAPIVEDSWPLAMDLFRPAFISGWSAAEYWDFTEQVFNTIAVVTTKPQRHVLVDSGGLRYRTRVINTEHFFGATTVWLGSKAVEIADPSRVVVDILDMPSFGGGARHTADVVRAYWRSEHKNPALLLEYAKRYGRGVVFKRLGFLAEMADADVDENWLRACREHMSSGVSKLDPDGPARGKIVSRWRLRINIPIEGT